MRTFGLIGYPIHYSYSKNLFERKFEDENLKQCNYELFPLSSLSQLNDLLKSNHHIIGLNITIPYKEQIIAFLNEIDEVAKQVKAVNTILIKRIDSNYSLKGFNTDVYGFQKSLLRFIPDNNLNALILGNGGASKAAQFVCKTHGINYKIVSRNSNEANSIDFLSLNNEILYNYQLIINCTPIGTFGNLNKFPFFPYELINSSHFVFDMVYNPSETDLMKEAKKRGAKVINGLEMLQLQAQKSWDIWNNIDENF